MTHPIFPFRKSFGAAPGVNPPALSMVDRSSREKREMPMRRTVILAAAAAMSLDLSLAAALARAGCRCDGCSDTWGSGRYANDRYHSGYRHGWRHHRRHAYGYGYRSGYGDRHGYGDRYGDGERDDDAISPLQGVHAPTLFFDDAHELVSEDVTLLHGWNFSAKDVQIRATDRSRRHP